MRKNEYDGISVGEIEFSVQLSRHAIFSECEVRQQIYLIVGVYEVDHALGADAFLCHDFEKSAFNIWRVEQKLQLTFTEMLSFELSLRNRKTRFGQYFCISTNSSLRVGLSCTSI